MCRRSRVGVGTAVGVALVLLAGVPELSAQGEDGSTGAALGGAALGAYSGTVLGLLGAFGPCNRIQAGTRCPRVAVAIGGTLGLAAGARMGSEDTDAFYGRLRGAGYGALIGGVVGYGLSRGVRQYGWPDVGMFLAVGAGIGASPAGAGLGFGAGAIVGTLSWMIFPEIKLGDAAAISLVGMAVGGLAGWVVGTDTSGERRGALLIPLQVRF